MVILYWITASFTEATVSMFTAHRFLRQHLGPLLHRGLAPPRGLVRACRDKRLACLRLLREGERVCNRTLQVISPGYLPQCELCERGARSNVDSLLHR